MIKWRNLIKDLQKQRCVLLLGDALPYVDYEGEKMQLNHAFAKHIACLLNEENIEYEKTHQHNLHYVAQQYLINDKRKTYLDDEIEDVYEQCSYDIPNIYQSLAKLPFHLIINASPDDFMFRALQKENKKVQTEYYHFSKQQHEQNINDFDAEKPLVYNLFGSLNDASSAVLTAKNEVEFVHSIVSNAAAIPDKIINNLKNVSLLFLGFDFSLIILR